MNGEGSRQAEKVFGFVNSPDMPRPSIYGRLFYSFYDPNVGTILYTQRRPWLF